jgi:predicted nucleic acid-binding protein
LRFFIDTSCLYAYMYARDVNHESARIALHDRLGIHDLLTHSYVIVETATLVHRRLGDAAMRALFDDLVPALDVSVVGEDLHQAAVAAFLAGLPSRISLVDRTSFEFMRRHRIETAIVFDRDFAAEGFTTFPK